ncbi:hypothetical protein KO527_24640 [Pseudoalteromonas sp. C2R02]|uniref:hypothetical protein n=1 Tax=Pseudoalteromonas sp. C2R02 TaxID=2841565 RepID=UPI001C09BA2A|nr:hypothetical protein [Pseudoalteromonas sp. C2R02]MBU2972527.1 hypothetical protein [Pseudoalteromonas sp. C2R02]
MIKTGCSYHSIIKASGIYDILVLLPFAIPGIVEIVFTLINKTHDDLALTGSLPEFLPYHFMFVNIMAIISIVWAVIRIRNPIHLYACYDTITRLLIAANMLVYLLYYDITQIIWLFFIAEVSWAILQINGYFYKNTNAVQTLSTLV